MIYRNDCSQIDLHHLRRNRETVNKLIYPVLALSVVINIALGILLYNSNSTNEKTTSDLQKEIASKTKLEETLQRSEMATKGVQDELIKLKTKLETEDHAKRELITVYSKVLNAMDRDFAIPQYGGPTPENSFASDCQTLISQIGDHIRFIKDLIYDCKECNTDHKNDLVKQVTEYYDFKKQQIRTTLSAVETYRNRTSTKDELSNSKIELTALEYSMRLISGNIKNKKSVLEKQRNI